MAQKKSPTKSTSETKTKRGRPKKSETQNVNTFTSSLIYKNISNFLKEIKSKNIGSYYEVEEFERDLSNALVNNSIFITTEVLDKNLTSIFNHRGDPLFSLEYKIEYTLHTEDESTFKIKMESLTFDDPIHCLVSARHHNYLLAFATLVGFPLHKIQQTVPLHKLQGSPNDTSYSSPTSGSQVSTEEKTQPAPLSEQAQEITSRLVKLIESSTDASQVEEYKNQYARVINYLPSDLKDKINLSIENKLRSFNK